MAVDEVQQMAAAFMGKPLVFLVSTWLITDYCNTIVLKVKQNLSKRSITNQSKIYSKESSASIWWVCGSRKGKQLINLIISTIIPAAGPSGGGMFWIISRSIPNQLSDYFNYHTCSGPSQKYVLDYLTVDN